MALLGGVFNLNNNTGTDTGNQANWMLQAGKNRATGEYTSGEQKALGQYGTNYYDPYSQTGGAANSMYANALGLNGAGGNVAASGAFQANPGYQFAMDQGVQALDRSAAGKGFYGSGNAAVELNKFGQGQANQEYGNWLSRLQGLGAQGLQAAAGQTDRQGRLAGINQWGAGGRANAIVDLTKAQAGNLQSGPAADAAANAQGGANLLGALLGVGNLGLKAFGG